MALGVDADQTIRILAALVDLGLAAFLLAQDRRNRANLTFAIVLACSAANALLLVARDAAVALEASEAVLREILGWSQAPAIMGILFSVYFLFVFPRPRGFLGSARGMLAYAAFVVLVVGAYLARPTLLATHAMMDGRLRTVAWGPILLVALFPAIGLIAAAFARGALHATDDRSRRALYLVSLGAAASAIAGATRNLGDIGYLFGGPASATSAETFPSAIPIYAALRTGSIACVVLAIVWIAQAMRKGTAADRASLAFYLGVVGIFGLLGLASFALELQQGTLTGGARTFDRLRAGITSLALPLFASYALLRHRLFDLDVKVRWTVRASTVGGVFLAAFLVVSQLAQNYLSAAYGWALGGLAAGVMFVAIHPIQRVAERVANAAVPGARSASAMSHPERLLVYADAARGAWADGTMERAERAMLDRLRTTLGLSHEEAAQIETEAANARAPSP